MIISNLTFDEFTDAVESNLMYLGSEYKHATTAYGKRMAKKFAAARERIMEAIPDYYNNHMEDIESDMMWFGYDEMEQCEKQIPAVIRKGDMTYEDVLNFMCWSIYCYC